MTAPDPVSEAERVRSVYKRREQQGLDSRYAYWQPANLFIYQARERALLALLARAGFLPLGSRQVLELGCGDGGVLRELLRYGGHAENLHGIDLISERIESARHTLPQADLHTGDAQELSYEDASFDLQLCFTLLSSVVDDSVRKRIAAEMLRVARPGGLIMVYDFWTNPLNRHARPLRRADLRSLFPGRPIEFRRTTLAPPLLRVLMRLPGGWLASSLLQVIPFLTTHYVAAIRV